ncbi:hypothetical protein AVEN_186191-1 [Araneus ventricosus]|uniref:Integrase catalytic domain-containing protein n=1 Tax=Araneus ventricosus TaxID=182803 RepID=A0A4Y2GGK5_ARAVE|nr:hypothetical protein AVEN_186191-1 [Araneus ventricosus]
MLLESLGLPTTGLQKVFTNNVRCLGFLIVSRVRPTILYSENCTNFKGAERLQHALEWDGILPKAAEENIQWKFNPPSFAWWERLVQMTKEILRNIHSRAALNYVELLAVFSDCERVINSRPLTYVFENEDDVPLLTSEMFLREILKSGVVDIDTVDKEKLTERAKYLQKMQEQLRAR